MNYFQFIYFNYQITKQILILIGQDRQFPRAPIMPVPPHSYGWGLILNISLFINLIMSLTIVNTPN
jgi:hypothetical protein